MKLAFEEHTCKRRAVLDVMVVDLSSRRVGRGAKVGAACVQSRQDARGLIFTVDRSLCCVGRLADLSRVAAERGWDPKGDSQQATWLDHMAATLAHPCSHLPLINRLKQGKRCVLDPPVALMCDVALTRPLGRTDT